VIDIFSLSRCAPANFVNDCDFIFRKWQEQGDAYDHGFVSNIPAHKVFIKQKKWELRSQRGFARQKKIVRMIYDRCELSFRRVGFYHDVNEPHFRSPLVREVNCLKWPVHSSFLKFRMLLYFLYRSSNPENINRSENFISCKLDMKMQFLYVRSDLYLIF